MLARVEPAAYGSGTRSRGARRPWDRGTIHADIVGALASRLRHKDAHPQLGGSKVSGWLGGGLAWCLRASKSALYDTYSYITLVLHSLFQTRLVCVNLHFFSYCNNVAEHLISFRLEKSFGASMTFQTANVHRISPIKETSESIWIGSNPSPLGIDRNYASI